MPSYGDTRISATVFTADPADNEIDVLVTKTPLTYLLKLEEYLSVPFDGWFSGSFLAMFGAGGYVFTDSPSMDHGSLSFIVGSPQTWTGTIIIPLDSDLDPAQIYTWQVNLNIVHNTSLSGVVPRNYTTELMTFTTAGAAGPSKPTNPDPAHTDTGIELSPLLSWTQP
jgi:hypothetical protein